MASSSADLRFRRRAVDFVGQQDVARKSAPGTKVQRAMAGDRILFDDVGAGDIGRHQVRRELDALENPGRASDSVRTSSVFAVPGKPVIRQWPPTNSADPDLIDHFVLAHDDPADLAHDVGIEPSGTAATRDFSTSRIQVKGSW